VIQHQPPKRVYGCFGDVDTHNTSICFAVRRVATQRQELPDKNQLNYRNG
jgi:hypothetical protein